MEYSDCMVGDYNVINVIQKSGLLGLFMIDRFFGCAVPLLCAVDASRPGVNCQKQRESIQRNSELL